MAEPLITEAQKNQILANPEILATLQKGIKEDADGFKFLEFDSKDQAINVDKFLNKIGVQTYSEYSKVMIDFYKVEFADLAETAKTQQAANTPKPAIVKPPIENSDALVDPTLENSNLGVSQEQKNRPYQEDRILVEKTNVTPTNAQKFLEGKVAAITKNTANTKDGTTYVGGVISKKQVTTAQVGDSVVYAAIVNRETGKTEIRLLTKGTEHKITVKDPDPSQFPKGTNLDIHKGTEPTFTKKIENGREVIYAEMKIDGTPRLMKLNPGITEQDFMDDLAYKRERFPNEAAKPRASYYGGGLAMKASIGDHHLGGMINRTPHIDHHDFTATIAAGNDVYIMPMSDGCLPADTSEAAVKQAEVDMALTFEKEFKNAKANGQPLDLALIAEQFTRYSENGDNATNGIIKVTDQSVAFDLMDGHSGSETADTALKVVVETNNKTFPENSRTLNAPKVRVAPTPPGTNPQIDLFPKPNETAAPKITTPTPTPKPVEPPKPIVAPNELPDARVVTQEQALPMAEMLFEVKKNEKFTLSDGDGIDIKNAKGELALTVSIRSVNAKGELQISIIQPDGYLQKAFIPQKDAEGKAGSLDIGNGRIEFNNGEFVFSQKGNIPVEITTMSGNKPQAVAPLVAPVPPPQPKPEVKPTVAPTGPEIAPSLAESLKDTNWKIRLANKGGSLVPRWQINSNDPNFEKAKTALALAGIETVTSDKNGVQTLAVSSKSAALFERAMLPSMSVEEAKQVVFEARNNREFVISSGPDKSFGDHFDLTKVKEPAKLLAAINVINNEAGRGRPTELSLFAVETTDRKGISTKSTMVGIPISTAVRNTLDLMNFDAESAGRKAPPAPPSLDSAQQKFVLIGKEIVDTDKVKILPEARKKDAVYSRNSDSPENPAPRLPADKKYPVPEIKAKVVSDAAVLVIERGGNAFFKSEFHALSGKPFPALKSDAAAMVIPVSRLARGEMDILRAEYAESLKASFNPQQLANGIKSAASYQTASYLISAANPAQEKQFASALSARIKADFPEMAANIEAVAASGKLGMDVMALTNAMPKDITPQQYEAITKAMYEASTEAFGKQAVEQAYNTRFEFAAKRKVADVAASLGLTKDEAGKLARISNENGKSTVIFNPETIEMATQRQQQQFDSIVTNASVDMMVRNGKDGFNKPLSPQEAKARLEAIAARTPENTVAGRAIRSMLSDPQMTFKVVNHKSIDATTGKQVVGTPLSGDTYGSASTVTKNITVAVAGGNEGVILDTMLEESLHRTMGKVYGGQELRTYPTGDLSTNRTMISNDPEKAAAEKALRMADSRKKMLQKAIIADVNNSPGANTAEKMAQLRKDVGMEFSRTGGERAGYINGESHAELVVKVIKMRELGTWTPELAQKYPNLDKYVKEVAYPDVIAQMKTEAAGKPWNPSTDLPAIKPETEAHFKNLFPEKGFTRVPQVPVTDEMLKAARKFNLLDGPEQKAILEAKVGPLGLLIDGDITRTGFTKLFLEDIGIKNIDTMGGIGNGAFLIEDPADIARFMEAQDAYKMATRRANGGNDPTGQIMVDTVDFRPEVGRPAPPAPEKPVVISTINPSKGVYPAVKPNGYIPGIDATLVERPTGKAPDIVVQRGTTQTVREVSPVRVAPSGNGSKFFSMNQGKGFGVANDVAMLVSALNGSAPSTNIVGDSIHKTFAGLSAANIAATPFKATHEALGRLGLKFARNVAGPYEVIDGLRNKDAMQVTMGGVTTMGAGLALSGYTMGGTILMVAPAAIAIVPAVVAVATPLIEASEMRNEVAAVDRKYLDGEKRSINYRGRPAQPQPLDTVSLNEYYYADMAVGLLQLQEAEKIRGPIKLTPPADPARDAKIKELEAQIEQEIPNLRAREETLAKQFAREDSSSMDGPKQRIKDTPEAKKIAALRKELDGLKEAKRQVEAQTLEKGKAINAERRLASADGVKRIDLTDVVALEKALVAGKANAEKTLEVKKEEFMQALVDSMNKKETDQSKHGAHEQYWRFESQYADLDGILKDPNRFGTAMNFDPIKYPEVAAKVKELEKARDDVATFKNALDVDLNGSALKVGDKPFVNLKSRLALIKDEQIMFDQKMERDPVRMRQFGELRSKMAEFEQSDDKKILDNQMASNQKAAENLRALGVTVTDLPEYTQTQKSLAAIAEFRKKHPDYKTGELQELTAKSAEYFGTAPKQIEFQQMQITQAIQKAQAANQQMNQELNKTFNELEAKGGVPQEVVQQAKRQLQEDLARERDGLKATVGLLSMRLNNPNLPETEKQAIQNQIREMQIDQVVRERELIRQAQQSVTTSLDTKITELESKIDEQGKKLRAFEATIKPDPNDSSMDGPKRRSLETPEAKQIGALRKELAPLQEAKKQLEALNLDKNKGTNPLTPAGKSYAQAELRATLQALSNEGAAKVNVKLETEKSGGRLANVEIQIDPKNPNSNIAAQRILADLRDMGISDATMSNGKISFSMSSDTLVSNSRIQRIKPSIKSSVVRNQTNVMKVDEAPRPKTAAQIEAEKKNADARITPESEAEILNILANSIDGRSITFTVPDVPPRLDPNDNSVRMLNLVGDELAMVKAVERQFELEGALRYKEDGSIEWLGTQEQQAESQKRFEQKLAYPLEKADTPEAEAQIAALEQRVDELAQSRLDAMVYVAENENALPEELMNDVVLAGYPTMYAEQNMEEFEKFVRQQANDLALATENQQNEAILREALAAMDNPSDAVRLSINGNTDLALAQKNLDQAEKEYAELKKQGPLTPEQIVAQEQKLAQLRIIKDTEQAKMLESGKGKIGTALQSELSLKESALSKLESEMSDLQDSIKASRINEDDQPTRAQSEKENVLSQKMDALKAQIDKLKETQEKMGAMKTPKPKTFKAKTFEEMAKNFAEPVQQRVYQATMQAFQANPKLNEGVDKFMAKRADAVTLANDPSATRVMSANIALQKQKETPEYQLLLDERVQFINKKSLTPKEKEQEIADAKWLTMADLVKLVEQQRKEIEEQKRKLPPVPPVQPLPPVQPVVMSPPTSPPEPTPETDTNTTADWQKAAQEAQKLMGALVGTNIGQMVASLAQLNQVGKQTVADMTTVQVPTQNGAKPATVEGPNK